MLWLWAIKVGNFDGYVDKSDSIYAWGFLLVVDFYNDARPCTEANIEIIFSLNEEDYLETSPHLAPVISRSLIGNFIRAENRLHPQSSFGWQLTISRATRQRLATQSDTDIAVVRRSGEWNMRHQQPREPDRATVPKCAQAALRASKSPPSFVAQLC